MHTKYTAPHRKIYRLVFSDGQTYVGATTTSLRKRLSRHRADAKHRTTKVYVAWRTLGEPLIELLAVVDARIWVETERRAIEVLQPSLNTDPGGTGVGRVNAEATRLKIGLANKGKVRLEKRVVSAETRVKISRANKGKTRSEKRIVSAETRAKMRAAKLGRKHTAEHNAKIGAALRSRKCR